MFKLTYTIFLFFIICFTAYSQDYIFRINGKKYTCSDEYALKSELKCFFYNKYDAKNDYDVNIRIIKNGSNAMIALSNTSYHQNWKKIRPIGTIYIYLEDGSEIKCLDRKIYDFVNNKGTTIYYLNQTEINAIKASNISSIRLGITDNDLQNDYIVYNKMFTQDELNNIFGSNDNSLFTDDYFKFEDRNREFLMKVTDFSEVFNELFN